MDACFEQSFEGVCAGARLSMMSLYACVPLCLLQEISKSNPACTQLFWKK